MRKLLLFLAALVIFTIAGGYYFYVTILNSPLNGTLSKTMEIEVTTGMTVSQVIEKLEKEGLIQNPYAIILAARIQKLGAKLKVGDYEVSSTMTVANLFDLLQTGKMKGRMITIPEGYNIFEIAKIFEKEALMSSQDFLTHVRNPDIIQSLTGQSLPSLEGYLFPESYQVTAATKGVDLIRRMVKTFFKRYQEFAPLEAKLGWTQNQVITLASIVEKETGAPWERPLIASVFHNRIKKRMKLQTDPTVLYAKSLSTGSLEMNITRADLSLPHPYNTYYIPALPPGPIANPGTEAIRAVFLPEKNSEFLYFVSRNDGTHIFSKTYEEHIRNVTEFQKNPKSRNGKSWRQLSEKLKKPTN
jgi:UPF0755 protein